MNIKVNNEYLDFNDDIQIERQVSLFEESAEVTGDFSYSFTIKATSKNRGIINLFTVNQASKTIYSKIPTVLSNDGIDVYHGFIRVDKDRGKEIDCTFFSGNTNWLSALNFELSTFNFTVRDFDFSVYDMEFNLTEVAAREQSDSGIIFPLINLGAVTTRSSNNWLLDDFHPFVYVHSVIKTLFNRNGLKLQGDILNDWRFNRLITSRSGEFTPKDEIDSRSTFVNKSTSQNIPAGSSGVVVTFANTTGDYYPGDLWNTGTHRYTSDFKVIINVSVVADVTVSANESTVLQLIKNGSTVAAPGKGSLIFGGAGSGSTGGTVTLQTVQITLDATEYLDLRAYSLSSVDPSTINSATITITPIRVYKVFTKHLLPSGTAADFVKSVFSLFNTIIDYNPISKTVTVDLFKNVVRRDELDISKYIDPNSIEIDYSDVMSNYGRINNFSYGECDADLVKTYNENNNIQYGTGQIDSRNDTNKPVVDVFSSNFIATMEDNKNPLNSFLPRLSWRSVSDDTLSTEGAAVTNSAGFLITASGYAVGDLVRITDSTVEGYDGDWVITTATSTTFKISAITYNGNATVNVQRLKIDIDSKGEQALLLSIPNINVQDFSSEYTAVTYGPSTGSSSPATAYFYKPLQGLAIDDYKQSLSFGGVNIENAHQSTMLQDYWDDFRLILSDPAKCICSANIPKSIFESMFIRPIRINANNINIRSFTNRITGYTSSKAKCEVELIKL